VDRAAPSTPEISSPSGETRCYAAPMPLARIEVRRPRPEHEVQALITTVYEALRAALKVPEGDRNIRYLEYPPERFATPPDRTDDYTIVEITLLPGRSLEAKRTLYRLIVGGFGELGIDPADVLVVLHEPPLENWGIRGGQPASEIDLGFSLDV